MDNLNNKNEISGVNSVNFDDIADNISLDTVNKILDNNWWFSEVADRNGKKVFGYTEKNWQKREIIVEKSNTDEYKVRVKKYTHIPALWREDWQTQKNWENELFQISANDWKEFMEWLIKVVDSTVWFKNIWWKNLIAFWKIWKEVFKWLNLKTDLRRKPINLKYENVNQEIDINVNYPKESTSVEWRITRCLRFKSVTDATEDRYWIPRWLLMALMAQEWRWDPTVINKRSSWKCDWWAGLIHIQAKNAADYWLNTIQRDTDSMIDFEHWNRLIQAKADNNNDLKALSELDDRFNPVLSVDVAARFLMQEKWWKNAKTWEDWIKAINDYAWRWMSDYWYPVLVYWTTINSIRRQPMPVFNDKEINKVIKWECSVNVNWTQENVKNCVSRTKTAISNLNPIYDWIKIPLNMYYQYLRLQWNNYWLGKYIQYDKNHPYTL